MCFFGAVIDFGFYTTLLSPFLLSLVNVFFLKYSNFILYSDLSEVQKNCILFSCSMLESAYKS